jgi:hypothetical protein
MDGLQELESGELEQFDRLLQLRGHDQLLCEGEGLFKLQSHSSTFSESHKP